VVDDLPEPVPPGVRGPDRVLLALEETVDGVEGAARRVDLGDLGVDLVDGVGRAVDLHVQAHVEDVLVDGGVEPTVVQRLPVLRLLPRRLARRRQDARGLDQELDGPVEVEVPVEAVLVVGHRRDEGDDQPAGAADLGLVEAEVVVLPGDGVVLLVHAHGVADGQRVAVAVADHAVEVADLPEAVTAEAQRVGQRADVVLPGVEGVLLRLHRRGVAVGHDHLHQRGAGDDRPVGVAVAVAQLVQHQPLPGGEPDAERPVGPADVVALDLERRPFRLGDLDRLQVRARRADVLGQVVAGLLRDRDEVPVLHGQHLPGVEVVDDDEVLGRMRVRVVPRVQPRVDQRPDQPAPLVVDAVVAGRPWLDADQVQVGHPAATQRLDHPGVGLARLLGLAELVQHDRRLRRHRQLRPLGGDPGVQVDHGLEGPAGAAVDEDGERLADHRLRRRDQLPLVRLAQAHRDEPEALRLGGSLPEHLDRAGDLLGGQRVERVGRDGRLVDLLNAHPSLL
jgi:hypothetical protein